MNTKTYIPFVHYHCDCPDLKTSKQDHTPLNKNPALVDDDNSNNNHSQLSSSQRVSPSISTQLDPVEENSAIATGRRLLSHNASSYLYPLSRLYFCEDCHEIRCPCCVQDEIISYYCPNCLFEVPTASVKSEKNRCARNCFQCPVCSNTLAVMASQETAVSSSSSATANVGPYFLACNVCRWNSQEIGMVFEKPTSLAAQLQKNEKALPDVQEFDHLKEHFDKHLRMTTPSLPSNLLSFSISGTFNKLIGGNVNNSNIYGDLHNSANQQKTQGQLDDITTYETSAYISSKDTRTRDSLIGLRDMDHVSTLAQRYTQLHNQSYQMDQLYPQRIHLCVKRSKRCRTCRHILIKPEQKAQATRFKIKLVAMNYIPTITIINITTTSEAQQQQPLVLKPGIASQLALKFTNPLYEKINVTLATPPQLSQQTQSLKSTGILDSTLPHPAGVNGHVTILSPHFTVSAYNETIEYDDEMDSIGGFGSSHKKSKTSAPWASGIYEKRSNSTSVIIEVVPKTCGAFKFPLLVTCNYKSDEDRMDISSGDIDQEEIDNIDMDNSLDGSRKVNSSIRMDDEKTKNYSFWCLVDLGEVCV